jgi:hypothetical protein
MSTEPTTNGKPVVTKQCDRCGVADTGHPSGFCMPCRRKLAERFRADPVRRAAEIRRGSCPALINGTSRFISN